MNKIITIIARILYYGFEHLSNHRWFNYPFGKRPFGDINKYISLAKEASKKEFAEIDLFEKKSGYAIDQNWFHELALHTQIAIKKNELCYQHGRLLYSTLSKYLDDHSIIEIGPGLKIIETGTARGFSSLCMAKALSDQFRAGTILTFDFLPHNIQMYWNCIHDNDGPKSRAELLQPWYNLVEQYIIFHQGDTRLEIPKFHLDRIHFAFLDGAHTYEDVIFEFNHIRNRQMSGDIIIYDDYTPNQYPGIVKAIDKICEENQYSRTTLHVHTGRGYVVAEKE